MPELAVAVHVVTSVKHCLSVVSTPVSSVILSQDIAEDISVTVVSTSRSFVFCKARRVASFPAVFAAVASKPINVIKEVSRKDGCKISYQQIVYAMFLRQFKGVAYRIEHLLEEYQ